MLDTLITPEAMLQFMVSKPVQLVAEAIALGSLVTLWRAETEPIRRCAACALGGSFPFLLFWFINQLFVG